MSNPFRELVDLVTHLRVELLCGYAAGYPVDNPEEAVRTRVRSLAADCRVSSREMACPEGTGAVDRLVHALLDLWDAPSHLADPCSCANAVAAALPAVVTLAEDRDAEIRREACEKEHEPAFRSCQEVAERLKRLRSQGIAWKSVRAFADDFGCSVSTVHKALRSCPELARWAKRAGGSPRAQSLNPVVTDSTAQQTEPDPADDAAYREFIERADGSERAWFHTLSRDDQSDFLNDPDKYHRILDRKP